MSDTAKSKNVVRKDFGSSGLLRTLQLKMLFLGKIRMRGFLHGYLLQLDIKG
jgi:hypothetical protein